MKTPAIAALALFACATAAFEVGEGPAIVFVPGLGSSRADWLPVEDSLDIVRSLRRFDRAPAETVHQYYASASRMDFAPVVARVAVPLRALFSAPPSAMGMGAGRYARALGWDDTTRVAAAWTPGGSACIAERPDSLAARIARFAEGVAAAGR